MKVKRRKREAAAVIKFRRYGYSKSILAKAFCRSTSFIQDILTKAQRLGLVPSIDFRKMPNQTRRLSRALQWKRIIQWLPRWEKWIMGEGEKPP